MVESHRPHYVRERSRKTFPASRARVKGCRLAREPACVMGAHGCQYDAQGGGGIPAHAKLTPASVSKASSTSRQRASASLYRRYMPAKCRPITWLVSRSRTQDPELPPSVDASWNMRSSGPAPVEHGPV